MTSSRYLTVVVVGPLLHHRGCAAVLLQIGWPSTAEMPLGEVALIEQRVAAGAQVFIGTQLSMFTDMILMDRAVLGKARQSSMLFEAAGDQSWERVRLESSDGVLKDKGYDPLTD